MNETHYLVCDRLNRTAMLVDGDKLADAQQEYAKRVRQSVALVSLDLVLAREAFVNLTGPETRVFTRKEIAVVAGVNPPNHFSVGERGPGGAHRQSRRKGARLQDDLFVVGRVRGGRAG